MFQFYLITQRFNFELISHPWLRYNLAIKHSPWFERIMLHGKCCATLAPAEKGTPVTLRMLWPLVTTNCNILWPRNSVSVFQMVTLT